MITKCCIDCLVNLTLDKFSKNRTKKYGVQNCCKTCMSIRGANARRNDPLRVKAVKDRWNRKAGLEYFRLKRRREYASNVEREREKATEYRKRNADKVNAATVKRKVIKLKASPSWGNDFFIQEAYNLAQLRTKLFGFSWHVDHIVPLKSKLVCGLHAFTNLQVIPAIINLTKRNRYWQDMPT
jgi:hypothetical protein